MLKIYCKDPRCRPSRKHISDAGLDLRANDYYSLSPGITTKVSTGIHIEIPLGYVGLIFPHSGLSSRYGISLSNSVGVVDSGYRGEIICSIECHTTYNISKYDRIAQLVILPCFIDTYSFVKDISELSETTRHLQGFGSTGND